MRPTRLDRLCGRDSTGRPKYQRWATIDSPTPWGSDLGVDFDDVVFGVGEEHRAVPKELQVGHRLEYLGAALGELSGRGLDGAGRHSEAELNADRASSGLALSLGPTTEAQREQGRANLEFDPPLGDLIANLEAHHFGVETAHRLDVVTEQNRVIEVADGPEARRCRSRVNSAKVGGRCQPGKIGSYLRFYDSPPPAAHTDRVAGDLIAVGSTSSENTVASTSLRTEHEHLNLPVVDRQEASIKPRYGLRVTAVAGFAGSQDHGRSHRSPPSSSSSTTVACL